VKSGSELSAATISELKRLNWIVDGGTLLVSGVPHYAETLMKLSRTLFLVLMITIPAAAHAQINLAWNNCITQASATDNVQYACNGTASGTVNLVASFIPPDALAGFVGAEMYLTIATEGGPLPDFWDLNFGGCRENSLYFPAYDNQTGTGTSGACQNPWSGSPSGGGFAFDLNYLGTGATRIRTSRAIAYKRAMSAGQQYHGGVFTLDFLNSAETENEPFCAGCCTPVTITLTSIELYQEVGSAGGDIITLTAPATRNVVTWNSLGCNGSSSIPTPTRKTSWGKIKATYR